MSKTAFPFLDAGPFFEWLDWRIEVYGRVGVADRMGLDLGTFDRSLWRVEREQGGRMTVEHADDWLTRFDDGSRLADLWPELASRPELVGKPRDTRGRDLTRRRGVAPRLSDAQVRAAHRLHTVGGVSLRELGRRGWRQWGYSSPHTASTALSRAFARLGLKARGRIEATVKVSTVHGRSSRAAALPGQPGHETYLLWRSKRDRPKRRCKGFRTQYPRKGAPCQVFAMTGSDFCRHHDPELRAEVVAHLERVRAKGRAA